MSRPPFIADKQMFKAVSFAKKMIAGGDAVALAIYKSAKYYQLDQKELMSVLASHGVPMDGVSLQPETKPSVGDSV